MVLTGNGSDNLLDCAFRALAEPGEGVAYADPTFVMGPSFARANSLQPVGVPWVAASGTDLTLDAKAFLDTDARIIYLCSPNNPTGSVIAPDVIARIVREAPGVVLVDEAYFEFSDWTAASLLAQSPNLIVTRTLSKAFGLAGLRVGYALGDPAVLAQIAKARGPFSVSSVAEQAACAALTEDLDWMREHVALARNGRDQLRAWLEADGAYSVLESGANFLLVRPSDPRLPPVAEIDQLLRARGIAVRKFTALAGIGDALRITVGPWPMMQALLDALPWPDAGDGE
jgi:histidinol-phosphate aminotransferase